MNKDFEKINCPICSSGKTEIIAKRGMNKIPIYVSICPSCGLVYLNPRWAKKKYVEFYDSEYKKWRREETTSPEGADGKFSIVFERMKKYIPFKPLSILDIGAGKGLYLKSFKKQFPEISLAAIEPMLYCQDYLVNEIKADLLAGDAEANWEVNNQNKFDLIIMRAVLEHLLEPASVLKKVNLSLSDRGLVYLSVPNMMRPKMKGSLENYWFRAPHIFYFSKETLLAFMSKAGLMPIEMDDRGSEIWGIFKKGAPDFKLHSVYSEQDARYIRRTACYKIQKAAIRKFRIKYSIFSLKNWPKQLLKKILPEGFKSRIKRAIYPQ